MHECLKRELSYRTSRSSGPGGQHVNKTESRVELLWHLENSVCLSEEEKTLLRERLHSRITEEGMLILASEKHRSQQQNKADVTERFFTLIQAQIIPTKNRTPTKPTRSSIEKRISQKKIRGQIKRSRMKPPEQ